MNIDEDTLLGARLPDLRRLAKSIGVDSELPRFALIRKIAFEIDVRRADDAQRLAGERASWGRTAAARRAQLARPGQMTTTIGALRAAGGT